MADENPNVKKNPDTGDVVEVKLDEIIPPGDERWGVHNPVERETNTLGYAEEEVDTSAVQDDYPQEGPVASDELYVVDKEAQASQKEAAAASEKSSSSSSSKSDSSSKS